MNKFILSTLVALLLVSATLQAQVKDTYQDDSNELTTVVVKEDNANDMEILNGSFDLDDIGMHQVIRITTREEPTPEAAPHVDATTDNNVKDIQTTAALNPEPIEAPILTASTDDDLSFAINTEKTVREEKAIDDAPAPIAAPQKEARTQVTQRSSRSTSNASSRRKSSPHKFKAFNKKFKKQKRKRVPRKRKRNKRCYRF